MFCKCCLGDTSKASCPGFGPLLGLPLLWPLPPPCYFTALFCLFWRSQPSQWQLPVRTTAVLSCQALWVVLLLLNSLLNGYLSARGDWGINKPGGKLGSLMPCKGIANNICVFSRTPLFISELCGGGHGRRRLCVSLAKHRRNWKHNKLTVFWCKREMKDRVWDELQYLNQLLVFQTSSIPVRLIITATASLSLVRDADSQSYFGIQLVVGPLRICVDSRVTKWVHVALSLDGIVLSYFNKEEQWSGRNKMDATKIRGIMRSFALGWSTSSLELVLKVFRLQGVGNLQTWCFLFSVSFHSSPFSALDISDSWEHNSFLVSSKTQEIPLSLRMREAGTSCSSR